MATVKAINGKLGTTYKLIASEGYCTDGSQKRHFRTWKPPQGMTPRQINKELQRQVVLFEEECRNGQLADSNIKFEVFAKQWFGEYARPNLKTRTIDSYERLSCKAYNALGHLKMGDITTRTVQKFVMSLNEDGVNQRTGGKLAPKTIRTYLGFVSTVMDYAVTQGIVKANPCRGVKPPKCNQTEKVCYTLEEAQQFLELLEQEQIHWRSFFTLAIYGGFRKGELCGLEWKDVDWNSGVVTVNRTSLYTPKNGTYTDTPKTASSRRALKLPVEVIEVLRQHKKAQTEKRLELGNVWEYSDRLFVGVSGQPINPHTPQKWLHDFCEKTGMRQMGVHSFRHLNASLLINSGTDIRTVSGALGHSQTSTTLNIYTHAITQSQARASEAVANTLSLRKKATSTK